MAEPPEPFAAGAARKTVTAKVEDLKAYAKWEMAARSGLEVGRDSERSGAGTCTVNVGSAMPRRLFCHGSVFWVPLI